MTGPDNTCQVDEWAWMGSPIHAWRLTGIFWIYHTYEDNFQIKHKLGEYLESWTLLILSNISSLNIFCKLPLFAKYH